MTTLAVEIRNETGKGNARKLRASGRAPGTVYGPGSEPIGVAFSPDDLVALFKATGNRNTVVSLNTGSGDISCLVREVQRHPVSRDILHVDFYKLDDDRKIEIMVPVTPEGRPEGARLGGRLRLIRRELRATCLPKDIPAAFVIDVSPMLIGDIVKASEIALPSGVELVRDADFNVLSCYGKKAGRGGAAEGEGEGA